MRWFPKKYFFIIKDSIPTSCATFQTSVSGHFLKFAMFTGSVVPGETRVVNRVSFSVTYICAS